MVDPFVKWAGGKRQILDQLIQRLPPKVEERRYFEPFLGGGALFFSLKPKAAFLNDKSEELINLYVVVRDHTTDLIKQVTGLADSHSEKNYYERRDEYNAAMAHSDDHEVKSNKVRRAALFLYLNKTCFNGLYRVNKSGQFNVPSGKYKNPKVIDPIAVRAAARALHGVHLFANDFSFVLNEASSGDFIYFDPPYHVVDEEDPNFTGFTADGFEEDDQEELRDVAEMLSERRCLVMISNSDHSAIRKHYLGWDIDIVQARRSINSDGYGRDPVSELIIRNYE